LVLALGVGVSRSFTLVARIPAVGETADLSKIGEWLPQGLLRTTSPDSFNQPTVITLDGWDGKPRWRITTPCTMLPEPPGNAPWLRPIRAFLHSTDGHMLALVFTDGPHLRVASWRDGKPRGMVTLPRHPGEYDMFVGNNGVIWVYTMRIPHAYVMRVPAPPPVDLWRIDGEQLLAGTFPVPPDVRDNYHRNSYQLATDGSVMVCWRHGAGSNTSIVKSYYIEVKRQGKRMVMTKRFSIDRDLTAVGNKLAWGSGWYTTYGKMADVLGERLKPKPETVCTGDIDRTVLPSASKAGRPPCYTQVMPPHGQPWVIKVPNERYVSGTYSPDGRYGLVVEKCPPPNGVQRFVGSIPAVGDRYAEKPSERFALYEAPGKLRLHFPLIKQREWVYRLTLDGILYEFSLFDRPDRVALSPDGHHLGLTATRIDTNAKEYVICRW